MPDRIGIREALEHLAPFRIGKSTFYGTAERPGIRWTMVEELDIRDGPPVTLDRKKFLGWLRRRMGELARVPSVSAAHLGGRAQRRSVAPEYGESLAALCRAREAGLITEDEFQAAKDDLASARSGA